MSIRQKKKKCKECGNDVYLFSHGMCKKCYSIKNPPQIKKSRISKKPSESLRQRLKKYKLLKIQYLATHPICEVCLIKHSQDIHHKAGRIGDNLFQHFLAVCRPCHNRIEENPEWAYENNYSISRLNNE